MGGSRLLTAFCGTIVERPTMRRLSAAGSLSFSKMILLPGVSTCTLLGGFECRGLLTIEEGTSDLIGVLDLLEIEKLSRSLLTMLLMRLRSVEIYTMLGTRIFGGLDAAVTSTLLTNYRCEIDGVRLTSLSASL